VAPFFLSDETIAIVAPSPSPIPCLRGGAEGGVGDVVVISAASAAAALVSSRRGNFVAVVFMWTPHADNW
jgi:hypothetical protein